MQASKKQILLSQNVADCRQRHDHPWKWGHVRAGGGATGGGTTLVGSIAIVDGGGCGMGGRCSGCDRSESRGIERGS